MGEKIGKDPAVMRFVTTGKSFCGLFEKRSRSRRSFIEQVLKATVALYAAGLELPHTRPEREYNPLGEWWSRNKHLSLKERLKRDPKVRGYSRRYNRIRKQIAANLGGDKAYRKVFDPFASDDGSVTTTLSDDLADIYCDLQEGLLHMPTNSDVVPRSTIWQWKFNMQIHWGRHAVSALNALHDLAFHR
jgi:Domain of unknown function (DUF5063)